MMVEARLTEIPASRLEQAIGFNVRHKSAAAPIDYLKSFLRSTRQLGYATADDSWGELEKELEIIIRNQVRERRALQFISDSLCLGEGGVSALLKLGEEHWQGQVDHERRMAEFMERVRKLSKPAESEASQKEPNQEAP